MRFQLVNGERIQLTAEEEAARAAEEAQAVADAAARDAAEALAIKKRAAEAALIQEVLEERARLGKVTPEEDEYLNDAGRPIPPDPKTKLDDAAGATVAQLRAEHNALVAALKAAFPERFE